MALAISSAEQGWGSHIEIALVGCGGTGSRLLRGLAEIHQSLRLLGEETMTSRSLGVTVYDPDIVTHANVGRQLFARGDIGKSKATVLVTRINGAYETDWKAQILPVTDKTPLVCDLLISCVDTAAARRVLHAKVFDKHHGAPAYWLDCGNKLDHGQIVLGEPRQTARENTFDPHYVPKGDLSWKWTFRYGDCLERKEGLRLPCVTELYPELLDPSLAEDTTPSCSLVEALTRQDLCINEQMATVAKDLLWKLLFHGGISVQGALVNLREFRMNPLPLRLWPLKTFRGEVPAQWLLG